MSIGVLVDVNLKPGGAEKWAAALKESLPKTREWDGCEEIYLCVDQKDPNHLVIVEKWASNEAYAKFREWTMTQKGTEEMMGYVVGELTTTYLDNTGA